MNIIELPSNQPSRARAPRNTSALGLLVALFLAPLPSLSSAAEGFDQTHARQLGTNELIGVPLRHLAKHHQPSHHEQTTAPRVQGTKLIMSTARNLTQETATFRDYLEADDQT